MRATILAAGIGQRLEQPGLPPKILLRFGDESLLARHVHILRYCGVEGIDMVVGYQSELIEEEIARIGARDFVRLHRNDDYLRGSILSFWTLREVYASGRSLIFMDGDVLYDQRLIERLLGSAQANCFLMDRQTEEGEDPVKLCFAEGELVDFHKRPELAHDWWGEWIGFARFSPEIAAAVAAAGDRIVRAGGQDEIYESAFREVLVDRAPGPFGVEDVTGLPWVEIDFPEDLERAHREIHPKLPPLPTELVAE